MFLPRPGASPMQLLCGIKRPTSLLELAVSNKTAVWKCTDGGRWFGCRLVYTKITDIGRQQPRGTISRKRLLLGFVCSPAERRSFLKFYSTEVAKSAVRDKNAETSISVAENIKETTKTVSYTAIILVVFGVAAAVVYTIFSELFSSKSAHSVYSQAFAYVVNDERVRKVFGDSIKAFGEETRRGRRQRVSHVRYNKDNKNYLRMKFYIKGNGRGERGSVHLEMIENDKGHYEYRYLFVYLDGIHPPIILEDNRAKFEAVPVLSDDDLPSMDLSLK